MGIKHVYSHQLSRYVTYTTALPAICLTGPIAGPIAGPSRSYPQIA